MAQKRTLPEVVVKDGRAAYDCPCSVCGCQIHKGEQWERTETLTRPQAGEPWFPLHYVLTIRCGGCRVKQWTA